MATMDAAGSLTAAWDGTGVAPAGSVVQLTTADATSVGVEITGTFVATVLLEATMNGTLWFPVNPFTILGVGASATITAPGRCVASVADFVQVRARCSAFTSGAAVVTLDGSAAAGGGGGSGGGGGGGAMTVADGADTALGTTSDAGIITNIAGTVIGFLRGSIIQWAAFLARFPAALGSTTAANSLPVTLSTDGPFVTQTGSITETAPATDTAASGLNGRLQRVAQRLTSLIGLLPTALGATTAANSLPVTLSTDGQFVTATGSVTETAPATDTASSGLNGRLQRVAQRLTSLIALLPAALINGALAFTGDTAHGATDAGNPVEMGFGAVAHGANPTAVTAGQRTRGYANRAGIPFHIGGHPNVQTIATNFTAAQTDTALVTVATGLKIVVTSVMLKCHTANMVNVSARVGFGTANTPAYGSAGLLLTDPGIAPGSGIGRGNGAGILGVGTDDQDVRITCSVPTSGSIDAILSWYTVES
jgi:hypothetical protein